MRNQSGSNHNRSLSIKYLSPDRVRAILAADPRLIIPVGKTEEHGSHLPLGCDTIIVERLADDLSAEFGILRAPTIEYGVNVTNDTICPGNSAVRRKTLHRFLNDLIGHWEAGGVSEFIILTAHGFEPHQEALSTLYTREATVRMVDVFAVPQPDAGADWVTIPYAELDAALLLYIDATLVSQPTLASVETGEKLYRTIFDRISERVLRRDG
ncbi:MAG: creatininase family protein [Gemmatimonadetes bacterium]|nr:creatininase family protein [Gemmatimonadota bacterium]